MLQGTAS